MNEECMFHIFVYWLVVGMVATVIVDKRLVGRSWGYYIKKGCLDDTVLLRGPLVVLLAIAGPLVFLVPLLRQREQG